MPRSSSGLPWQVPALGRNDLHQFVPGFDERFGAIVLQFCRQRIDINAGFRELRQYVLAVAAIGRKDISDTAVIGKGLYGAFGHGVDRERRRQCLDVKDVGGGRVLGARARP
jgi:hypothetical protein